MIPSLRPYQDTMIGQTRVALRRHKRVLLQSPTGSGKTVLSAFMSGSATKKGLRVAFVCHRRELIRQTADTYSNVGIPFGIVSAGVTGDRNMPVQICGVNTLANRLDMLGSFDLVLWDEAHHVAAASWSRIMNHYPNARHVGLSATPERLDGTGLGQFFDAMVHGPRVADLIADGYLSPYRLFAPQARPDLDGIKTQAGDFKRDQLGEVMSKPALIGDMVSHYTKLAAGKRNMVFCVSVKHSMAVVERFQGAGYNAAHIDGSMDQGQRDRLIQAFTAGQIQVLSSVDLVSEGFDLPAIEVATLARPTQSLSLYLQQVGRCLRTAPGKAEAIVLDHAANSLPKDMGGRGHGLPDDDRIWSLAGRPKRGRGKANAEPALPMRQCMQCFCCHRPAPTCPRCGFEYPSLGRTVEELEGELSELQAATVKREARVEVAKAKTLEELIRIGQLRKYKNPTFWARKVLEGRGPRIS